MEYITFEDTLDIKELVTVGEYLPIPKGIYHYNSLVEMSKQGLIYKIALINSRMISSKSIEIVCSNDKERVKLKEERGKLWIYEVYDYECKAFERINSELITVYLEYSAMNGIEAFVRNRDSRK